MQKGELKKYDQYKGSGVEWLGEIPEQWEIYPLCAISKLKSITNCIDRELLSVYLDQGVIKFNDVTAKRTNVTSLDLTKYQAVDPGDFVLNNQQAWRGSVGVSNYEGIVSPAYIVLELFEKIKPRFANYLFRNGSMVSQYLICSKGVGTIQRNLYYPQLKRTNVCLPSIDEQTAIANFLDDKCGKIDQAIAQKQKLIELLKERKQILIQNAVTKGLDPNVKMKDSGIDWIGEIPETWEVKRLRYIGKTQNGISAGAEYFGEGFPFVSYGDVYNNRELPIQVKGLAKSPEADRKQYSVLNGDIFFTRTSETVAEIGFSSVCKGTITDATFSGFLIRFRPEKGILEPAFSKFYFSSSLHRAFFVKEMNLVIRASLSQDLLKRMPVLLPSLIEQKEIADFIENSSVKIDKAIDLQRKQIEKLKEYKASLINSAVTGKIKVC